MSGRPELVTPQLLRKWPLPEPGGSKHGRGQVLVVGGARSTPGAAMLAGIAALRVGAGVLCLAVAESVAAQVAVAVPECSVIALPQDETGAVTADAAQVLAPRVADCEVVLIGPGLDDADRTRELLEALVPHTTEVGQLVLDAYTLGVLTNVDGREQWRGRLTLTPNRDEAARLLGIDNRNLDRVGDEVEVAATVAERYGACVTYQGCVHDGESRLAGAVRALGTGHLRQR